MKRENPDILKDKLKLYSISFLIFILLIITTFILSFLQNLSTQSKSNLKDKYQNHKNELINKKVVKKVGVVSINNLLSNYENSKADIILNVDLSEKMLKFLQQQGFLILLKDNNRLFQYNIENNRLQEFNKNLIKGKVVFAADKNPLGEKFSRYKLIILVPLNIINQIKEKAVFSILGKGNVKILRIFASIVKKGDALDIIINKIIYKSSGGIKEWKRS